MANNLARYRGAHGLTQSQLAEKLGVTNAGISFAEKKKLSPKTAKRCAEILGENMFAIMGTDVLRVIPKTEADKAVLLEIVRNL